MAEPPEVEENKLNFSDIDSDDEESESNQKSTIARKDMSGYAGGQHAVESKSDKFEVDQNSGEQTFEPISPVSDTGNNFEAISPPVSPKNKDNNQFETISDDEEVEKVEDVPEGTFSPVQSDNELNFDDESSNDSGYQLVEPTSKPEQSQNENENNEQEKESAEKHSNENNEKHEDEDDDIEAPMPSPFSDLGDPNDITGTDGGIIDDILKDSETNEQNFITPSEHISEQSLNENTTLSESSAELREKSSELTEKSVDQSNETKQTEQTENDKSDVIQDEQVISEQNGGLGTSSQNSENEATEESNEDAGYLIANIFGDSDEEEEFVGFNDDDLLPDKPEESKVTVDKKEKSSKEEESDDDDVEIPARDFVSDFDLMLKKRKEMNRMKRRSKKDVDIINDNDDIIAAMLTQMKEAVEEDRISNQCGKAATKKLKMLPTIVQHLKKADLQHTFIDCGILAAMKDWLSPLPDHALPHINIRRSFLKLLIEFPPLDKGALKVSGIGRAVMLLFKHPKETLENKRLAGKIINIWARPIFNMSSNFHDMSREDREDRDKANLPEAKRRRLSSGADSSRNKLDEETDNKPRKPGDKGWIGRARVPMPSHRDYVNRPQSKVDTYDVSKNSKKVLSRYEKQLRKLKEKSSITNGNRKAVGVSVNGTNLSL